MEESDDMECYDMGDGYTICKSNTSNTQQKKVRNTTIGEEIAKAGMIATAPYITRDEAAWIETHFTNNLFSYIISGFSVALGFYMYYIIGELGITVLPDPLWNAVIIIGVLIIIISFLGFIQYRVTKALLETRIIERMARDNGNDKGTDMSI